MVVSNLVWWWTQSHKRFVPKSCQVSALWHLVSVSSQCRSLNLCHVAPSKLHNVSDLQSFTCLFGRSTEADVTILVRMVTSASVVECQLISLTLKASSGLYLDYTYDAPRCASLVPLKHLPPLRTLILVSCNQAPRKLLTPGAFPSLKKLRIREGPLPSEGAACLNGWQVLRTGPDRQGIAYETWTRS